MCHFRVLYDQDYPGPMLPIPLLNTMLSYKKYALIISRFPKSPVFSVVEIPHSKRSVPRP